MTCPKENHLLFKIIYEDYIIISIDQAGKDVQINEMG